MTTSKSGSTGQNSSKRSLRKQYGNTPGATNRGKSKRTLQYENSKRDNKSASGKDYP